MVLVEKEVVMDYEDVRLLIKAKFKLTDERLARLEEYVFAMERRLNETGAFVNRHPCEVNQPCSCSSKPRPLTDPEPDSCPRCGKPTYRIGGYCSRPCEKAGPAEWCQQHDLPGWACLEYWDETELESDKCHAMDHEALEWYRSHHANCLK